MEENNKNNIIKLNGLTNGIITKNISVIDLSHRNISNFDENIKLPCNLTELTISHNNLTEVPAVILSQKHLKILDISYNSIQYFDSIPNFCQSIEQLNISNNNLQSPPSWIWFDCPINLKKLDISCNISLTSNLHNTYFQKLLLYKTFIIDINISNCRLENHKLLLSTFSQLKTLEAGVNEMSYFAANHFKDIPCEGLDTCCDIERLNLCYTFVSNVKPNIDMYQNIKVLDLSQNRISSLPNEFGNLNCLEVCILSFNNILSLPDDIVKLKKLVTLCIDNNELCMLPDNLCDLTSLNKLDIYDNYLNEVPEEIMRLQEIDVAQNYLDEPTDDTYLAKREKLRQSTSSERYIGRKNEVIKPLSEEDSYDLTLSDDCSDKELCTREENELSSAEDWDSDEYWEPFYPRRVTPPKSPWLFYVKRKMQEGNFCPMDIHTVCISEKVRYEKMRNPQTQYESDGQFDDFSDDES